MPVKCKLPRSRIRGNQAHENLILECVSGEFDFRALGHNIISAIESEFWIMLIVRSLKVSDEMSFRACVEECRYDDPPHDFAFHFDSVTDFPSYVCLVDGWSRGEYLPPKFLPGAFLVAAVQDVVVGRVSIRYQLNDFLLRLGGHVGYAVAPSFRGKVMPRKYFGRLSPLLEALVSNNSS
jgi:hypothetical protein